MSDTTAQEVPRTDPARDVFDAVEQSGNLPSSVSVQDAVQEVLCAITRRVSQGQAWQLRQSLSPGVGELLRVCAAHRAQDPERFGEAELLEELAGHFGVGTSEAEQLARTVCAALRDRFSTKEIRDVESQLPGDIARIWRG